MQRRGDPRTALAELGRLHPGNEEARLLRLQLKRALVERSKWRIDVDGSYSGVGLGQPDWKEGSLRVSRQLMTATAVQAAVEAARRFGSTDVYGELRLERRYPGGSAYAVVGAAPGADFRPQWQLGAGGEIRLRPGGNATVLTIDGRAARYSAGDIQTLNPGVDQYFADGRAWLSVRWINLFDEAGYHGGWLARGDLLATERLRLFVGTAKAPETFEGVVWDSSSLFGGFAYELPTGLTFRVSLARDDPESGPGRLQIGIGTGWRF